MNHFTHHRIPFHRPTVPVISQRISTFILRLRLVGCQERLASSRLHPKHFIARIGSHHSSLQGRRLCIMMLPILASTVPIRRMATCNAIVVMKSIILSPRCCRYRTSSVKV